MMNPNRRRILLGLTLLAMVGLLTSLVAAAPPGQEEAFTIQADADLQGAVTALYGARYDGAEPVFVDADADLLATTDADAIAGAADGLPDYFLPEAALVPLTENDAAADFVAFAVSPDGQQVLIDEGLLPDTITLTDQAGNAVEIPQPVRRVISTHGPSVFFLYGVGAQDRIVSASYLGVGNPRTAAAMERIDPRFPEIVSETMTTREINVEEVALFEPDLVFTSPRSPWIETVQELGIPVFLYAGETPDLIREAMRLTGQIFGPNTTAQAEAWVDYYDSIFEAVAAQTADLADEDRVRVLFTGSEPLRVASGEMYQSALIEAAGGISATAELTGYWNDVNLEQIVLWNPDVILVPSYGGATVEAITDSPEWGVLDAVEAGQVYQLTQLVAPWDTPTPDSVLAIIWMAQLLYPDVVDLDCATETAYFYQTFYGYEISAEEVAGLCGSS